MTPIKYEVRDCLITLRDINLNFEDKCIIRDLSATVRDIVRPGCTQGQIVGILGPSGIGKTQLSRIMSGLQSPTSGSVIIYDGKRSQNVRPGLVGVVAQNYPLLRHRTILGNLIIAARQTGISLKDSRTKSLDMLSKFGLLDKTEDYPSQLSGGQRQRVAIAQQLLCSEHFIIMDEPFTGLDPLMKDKTCELISQVALMDERNTIFIVSHDISAAAMISDTLWLIGRDKSNDGVPIPGSRIQIQYDLAAMGLAWQPGLSSTSEFSSFVAEVKDKFRNL